jgi:hypothetical protein
MRDKGYVEEPESYEGAAREFLQWVEDRIKDVHGVDSQGKQHNKNLTPGDKWDLESAFLGLRPNFDGLVINFIEPMRGQENIRVESGFHFVWGLMYATFLAAGVMGISESAAKDLKAKLHRPGGIERGNEVKNLADKQWRTRALALAKEIQSEDLTIKPGHLIKEIRKRWPPEGGVFSDRQLADAIRKWKKSGKLHDYKKIQSAR